MIYKRAGSRFYMAKFRWEGRTIAKSTRCANAKDARTVEGKLRAELGKGNFGILTAKPRLTLREFLKQDFEPFIKTEHKSKPHTFDYYWQGMAKLMISDVAAMRLDQITGQHINKYIAQHGECEVSTINRDLRTLRRALHLAVEWGKLDRLPKVTLAKGENMRDRVLTQHEAEQYIVACPQPWKDVATVLLGTGMRPGEAYKLRWEHILLQGHGGLIQITEGKSKAARRMLPIVPEVYDALKTRHDAQGNPTEGWLFPTGSRSGHIEEPSAKQWHAKALAAVADARKENPKEVPEVSSFQPYCLRHTALTWLARTGCDAFTLARIAGHSNIRVTARYVHPETETVEAAFKKLIANRKPIAVESKKQVTDAGYSEKTSAAR